MSTTIPHPSECPCCLDGLHRMRQIARLKWRAFPVKTWCRVCGMPVLIEVKNYYEHALKYAYRLDDAIMEHHRHEESGNWGVHWRLDEVLRLVFPVEHLEDLWVKPPWYEHSMSENQMVVVACDGDECNDPRQDALIAQVNDYPKTRRELEQLGLDVWSRDEVGREFEILGYRAPFAVAERRADGMRGTLMFQHDPRFYFEFRSDRVL